MIQRERNSGAVLTVSEFSETFFFYIVIHLMTFSLKIHFLFVFLLIVALSTYNKNDLCRWLLTVSTVTGGDFGRLSESYSYLAKSPWQKTAKGIFIRLYCRKWDIECGLSEFFIDIGKILVQKFPDMLRGEKNKMILICSSQDPVKKTETILGISVEGI